MENLYVILDCSCESSYEELKKSYQRLALKYHPDKQAGGAGDIHQSNSLDKTDSSHSVASPDTFVKINQAWKILSDENLRKQYDVRWKQRCLAQDWPIQDEIDIEEFEENLDQEETLECSGKILSYPCRCGGFYLISETDRLLKFDLVCCDTCSLSVRVIYPL